ncbi:MAG TPA: ABC transporter substrate-binding protein [Casimicrobiaceae bacterium]|nr:ABC transporter substrate-binding protein [Casimicrobiaceae bacterium]
MPIARWARRIARAFVLSAFALSSPVFAQDTKVMFQLDWRFEGPAALFLLAKAKGYFTQEKLDVTIDAGSGSGNAVNRVASGTYQMGFADVAALIEFIGNNPTAPNKPIAVMMVYDATPAAVFSLKKANIKKPADLLGKKIGAPVFDAGRRAFPIFAKANGIDVAKVNWTAMEPALRETMLARGEVDAITGFYFTSLLNLNARGVKDEDIDVMMYPAHGVALYGNAIIASEQFVKERPEAVRGFLRAFTRAARDVLADPDGSIKFVKERDALIDEALERRRLRLAIDSVIATASAKKDGIGGVTSQRLNDMVSQVSTAFELKNPVKAEQVFNATFLPPQQERMIFK